MTDSTRNQITQGYARIAGLLYVLSNATAIFAFWARGQILVPRDPIATAQNALNSETLFRLGLAAELVTIVATTTLFLGLYVVLRPVDKNLARLALLWRVIENCVLASLVYASFTALALLQSTTYAPAADRAELAGFAYTLIRVHTYGFQVGFLFLGLGSALFSYLWFRSRYIPRVIAAWGIFASVVMAVVALALIIRPELLAVITLAYMAPMGIYEIGLGFWLLVRGVTLPEEAPRLDRELAG